jgi:hypothetical protein
MGLTVVNIMQDLRRKLGIMDADTAPSGANADCIGALNWALQTLAKAGADYLRREPISVTLVAGQAAYELADEVQEVLGPVVSAGKRVLRPLRDFADMESFGLVYLGQQSATLANGAPLAYHVRNTRVAAGDSHEVTLYVVPAPDAAAVTAHSPVKVDGAKTCPRYDVADVDSTEEVPVADGYCESLLLPLARLHVTRSHLFSDFDNLPRLQEDAALAMRTIGMEPRDAAPKPEAQQ